MLVYVCFDELEVLLYIFFLFVGEVLCYDVLQDYLGEYIYKYFKVGYFNFKVLVYMFDIKLKVICQVKLLIDVDGYILCICFIQDFNKLVIMILNCYQNCFDMYFVDFCSIVCKLVLCDEFFYYINENVFDNIQFYFEYFSFVSDKSGYFYLYWYSMNGNLIK